MARDKLWQPVPITLDSARKLEPSTLIATSSKAPLLANLSFEHGIFTFPNSS